MMRMLRWLLQWWHKRQRDIDVQILWPQCRDNAPDLNLARAAFTMHAMQDDAWLSLGVAEIHRRIDELT